jgi:hypothetical protein
MPRGKSRGRKGAGQRQAARRAPATVADAERLLDEVDAALADADPARLPRLLESLWAVRRRLPELLTQRLIDGHVAIPAFSFQLLQSFAGPQAPSYLKRIAVHRSVPDLVRWGAQRRAGWPERSEAKRRREFLATLTDPMGTLVAATAEATSNWPPEGEILQEVVGYLVALPAAERRGALERHVGELDAQAGWLLHAALHIPDPRSQRLVLDALVRLREPGAAGPIERLERTARDGAVRTEAAAALQRLRLHAVDAAAPAEPLPLPPVARALMSIVDGVGAQVILVLRDLGPAGFTLADFLLKEGIGIKDAFGLSHLPPDDLEEVMDGFVAEAVDLIEVDLPAVRGALADAVAINAASGEPVPPAFELWEPATTPMLDDAAYARRADLLRQSGRLLDHDYFVTWGFEAPEVLAAIATAPPPTSTRWSDRQFRPLIEQLVPPPVRARLRDRLRRQAWLLEREGDTTRRDQALAVAAALAHGAPDQLAQVPFLRRLVQDSAMQVASALLLPSLLPPSE